VALGTGLARCPQAGRTALRPPVFVADPAQLAADRIVLSGAEGRHGATVRRLAPGERADVTDGAGTVAECVVAGRRAGQLELTVLARRADPPPSPRVVVVQAIPKGDRGELAVEIMTEVGVDVIVPWAAEHCVAQWRGDRGEKALGRWRVTATQAAKQARRARFPEVAPQATTKAAAALVSAASLAVILEPSAPAPLHGLAVGISEGDVVLVIGPEGGISPAEASLLAAAGAVSARLAPSILRASSAGAVAAAIVLTDTGRWD
jgi:16S rRNA (uracil1498-N3)-methyltransferase